MKHVTSSSSFGVHNFSLNNKLDQNKMSKTKINHHTLVMTLREEKIIVST